MERLRAGAHRLGLALSDEQLAQFQRYYELLVQENQRVNITRVVEYEAVQERHFLDSLTCLLALGDLLRDSAGLRLIDVGSGAGFPGLPLKIALPTLELTLLDALGKRVAFLERLVGTLGLRDVQIVAARAEDAAHRPEHRERYDVATARALAKLPVLLELCLPFVRVGGRLVAPRKGELEAELRQAAGALRELGGGNARLVPVTLPGLDDGRALFVADKERPTPARYPRRAGVPERRPLAVTIS